MAVSKVHIEFVLDDKFSGPMRGANSTMNQFTRNMTALGAVNSLNNINKQVGEINTSLKSAYGTLAKFSGAVKALGTLGNVLSASFGSFFEYAKSFQTNAVGISGILASMTTINGKQMDWNQSMGISKEIMRQLRIEALQTAATSTDLIDTFRGLLGPGLGAGMSIDQIMKFTSVGVNAVKSMGLPSNQFLQELRGLEQGGIRASSSTLATALGLKDEDIKNAKASSEGLFNFLMKRLEGFKLATAETANTMAGQYEIVKEAMMNIGAEASESVLQTYSNALKELSDIMLKKNDQTGMFEINPKAVEFMTKLGEGADYLLTKAIAIGKEFANGWVFYATAFTGMVVLPKIFDATANAVTGLGTRLANVAQILFKAKLTAEEQQAISRSNALQKFADLDKEYTKEKELISQKQTLTKEVEKYVKSFNKIPNVTKTTAEEVEKYIKSMIDLWGKLGLSEQEANKRAIEYMKTMTKGTEMKDVNGVKSFTEGAKAAREHAAEVNKSTLALQNQKPAAEEHEGAMKKAFSAVSQFSGALSSVALALTVVTGAEDGWVKSLSDGLFAVDATVTGLGSMGTALQTITAWWNAAGTAAQLAIAKMGLIGSVIAVAGGAMYLAKKHYDELGLAGFAVEGDEVVWRSKEEVRDRQLGGASSATDAIMLQELAAFEKNGTKKTGKDAFKGVGMLYERQEEDKKAQKAAEKAAKELKQATKQYELLEDTLKVSIAKSSNHYSALQEKNAAILKQDEAWSQKIQEMAEKGVSATEIQELTLLKDKAIKEQYLAAERDFNQKLNDLKLDSAKNTMLFGGTQEEQYKAVDEALAVRRAYYESLLADENLAKDKRIEIEKQYAETVKQIRDNSMYDFKSAWYATLNELSQQQINYGERIKGVFSSIESAGTSLLTSTESFGTRIKTFFSDIASSIMAEMSKLIMKALITNVLLKSFSGLFGGGSVKATSLSSNMDLGTGAWGGLDASPFAKGGYASGWSIVGEQGPELVNFSNPARVYTAQQTANALGSAGSNVNIKIDLKNESGQQLEAEQTGSSFDGENYIVGVVLKAISSNKYGMRTTLKGLANT